MANGKRVWRYKEPEKCYLLDQKKPLPAAPPEGSDVVNFFAGKNVFLTGATGFLGKIAIEKLLRCCPDISALFIMCRDKKGKNIHDRTEELFNDVLFTRLNELHPKSRHKVTPIRGDVSEVGLGISPSDRELLTEKVHVIFHVAATVRFDEHIRSAANTNVRGTREMLRLAKDCQQLEAYVHVSTAFSQCNRQFIDECYYDVPTSYEDLEAMLNTHSDEELERMCVYKPWPNTYTFTKAIAEQVVKTEAGTLPVAIFRPSIVVSTYSEPVRGWIDNVYGPTGVLTGAGIGILRSLYCDGKNVAEIVPVDWVVNAMIATAYANRRQCRNMADEQQPPKIYNYVSSVENPLTWEEFCNMNRHYGINVPTLQAFWYYSFRLNKYKPIHFLYVFFLQWLPAFLLDGLGLLVGKKPQLVKIYKKIDKFANVISYFSIRRWFFKNNRMQDLWTELSDEDRRLFPFDIKLVDWEAHSLMNCWGVRCYIIKEDTSTLPAARKKWQRLYVAHQIIKYTFYLVVLRFVYGFLAMILNN